MRRVLIAVCIAATCLLFGSCATNVPHQDVAVPDVQKPASAASAAAEAPPVRNTGGMPPENGAPAPEPGNALSGQDGASVLCHECPSAHPKAADDDSMQNVPADYVKCEVRVELGEDIYTAQAAGPSIEEALDGAIFEAASIACADEISHDGMSDDEIDAAISGCVDKHEDSVIVIAAACSQYDEVVYTDGAWDDENSHADSDDDMVAQP